MLELGKTLFEDPKPGALVGASNPLLCFISDNT
jgi:hypothetical protein